MHKSESFLAPSTVLADYALACQSRHVSLTGRREVFMGKAKFGIFGDGKEVAQIAMAKVFRKGDFRAGYYRDQTFMFAIGELTLQQYFAQLYAHADTKADIASAGRMMTSHFATRMLDEEGNYKSLTQLHNVSADISPTAGQMSRWLGLAYASKLYRELPELSHMHEFSNKGKEIVLGTIGDSSTSEGVFFEAINAAGVLQVPGIMSVWDDGYGISVPKKYQTTKNSISKALAGMEYVSGEGGVALITVNGWDYVALCNAYKKAEVLCRKKHIPVLVHVCELTQPQGHSTSGSHERYKSKERLLWEKEHDCIAKMREWIISQKMTSSDVLEKIEEDAKQLVKKSKQSAWAAFSKGIRDESKQFFDLFGQRPQKELQQIRVAWNEITDPTYRDNFRAAKQSLRVLRGSSSSLRDKILDWLSNRERKVAETYHSHLYSKSQHAALHIKEVPLIYSDKSPELDGREVLQACFDNMLQRDPRVIALGEDVGKIGDVNQGFAGLQEKYGPWRVIDTGIRENTIIGQGIGAALRGLRPVVEIQYIDYLLYALQPLSDDLATLHYRTKGGQKAPLIVRTRGHRLEGMWHAGSPMSMILGSLRGMYIITPRNMTQAAGFYNTMLLSDDAALIIECLNGYRLKERLPDNVGEFTVPLGIPDVLREGEDVTVVTYGSMCKIVMDAVKDLKKCDISCEVIDVQTLIPFDIHHKILTSIQKTNRLIFADEDVPGGATAYMMQQSLEVQGGYQYLDALPTSVTAQSHRPAYGSDGDYFSKPNAEDVFDTVYGMMNEADPNQFPPLYK